MERLASPLYKLQAHYDVVVIGSGYGGGVSASRMARAGRKVCVLERGEELLPGEYPTSLTQASQKAQVDTPEGHLFGDPDKLFDLHLNPDIHVLVGSGLGGTSLINAGVAELPDPRVFDDPVWPAALRADHEGFHGGAERALAMLGASAYPGDAPVLAKLNALGESAAALDAPMFRPRVCVNFSDGVNAAGVEQPACTLCGDCVSGCNVGAKNTTLMNYLPDARRHGAEIFCGAQVRWLQRCEGYWLVHFRAEGLGRELFGAPELYVSADEVFLAAGSLGSTEILLRSAERGLELSPTLGTRFSSNGDVLGFGYNCDRPINGVGRGAELTAADAVGPCITGLVDLRAGPLEEGMVIEEGALPSAMASVLPQAFAAGSAFLGDDTDHGWLDGWRERWRQWKSLLLGPYRGAVHNAQTYLVMAHDDAGGRIRLREDRPRVDWPGVGTLPVFERVNRKLWKATAALGGTYIPNPIWNSWLRHDLITVHPLGGCPMGENGAGGVVDHLGAVFRGESAEVWPGLHVMDGAVMPRSLGINPLLTISALAERSCAAIAAARGWSIAYGGTAPAPEPTEPKPGIRFTETMRGELQRGDSSAPFAFTLTVVSEDLQGLIEAGVPAAMVGTVEAPGLHGEPLLLTGGTFSLFSADPTHVETRRMEYAATLTAVDGTRYLFSGYKLLHDDAGFDMWADTTTLFIAVRAEDGSEIGTGRLIIELADFARQMRTIEVLNVAGEVARLGWLARFGRFFAGTLFDLYGGPLAPLDYFDPEAPPRVPRPLHLPEPEIHAVQTDDGVALRLTRYHGGGRGPVMLLHGLGVSSRIFTVDTIETNLAEYLCAEGYDLWLLDFRASVELPASRGEVTADKVARYDYPAAVARIRELTGAGEIDVVAHCYGAATLAFAMLEGLQGVRSILFSQVAVHMDAPLVTRVKAGLHLPGMLEALGIERLSAYTDRESNWAEHLLDEALRLELLGDAEERCHNPVCHRVSFLYGLLYEHAQLAPQTHKTLHELFGLAAMSAMSQLADMVRHGQLVNEQGAEVAPGRLGRLALPVTFIHGERNLCYLPSSTEKTLQALCAVNDPGLYQRHVIPGYGHIDCIFGRDAVHDVYPLIRDHLARQGK